MHSESATVFRNVRPYGAEKPQDLTVVDGVFTDSPHRAAPGSSTARGGSPCRRWWTPTSIRTRRRGASHG